MSSPSRGLWLHGFSTYACFPAAQVRMVAEQCQWLGAALASTSTDGSSRILLKSVTFWGAFPNSCSTILATLSRRNESTSQTYFTWTLGCFPKLVASSLPRAIPMIPTTTRLLGESDLDVVLAETVKPDATAPSAVLPRKRRRSMAVDMIIPPYLSFRLENGQSINVFDYSSPFPVVQITPVSPAPPKVRRAR